MARSLTAPSNPERHQKREDDLSFSLQTCQRWPFATDWQCDQGQLRAGSEALPG